MNLALKYRPKQFSEVVGQKAISVILSAIIAKDKLAPVLLFTGPSGVGKTSMARIIAAALNPDSAEDVHQGTHPAVLEIDAASNGSVEAIRSLKKILNYVTPGHRVIIIDEAHALSDEAKAALLNMLEFPYPNVTVILITTEAHKIPKTIRHRCDLHKFKKASVEDLVTRIWWVATNENIALENELVELIAQRSEGSFREAMMILDQLSSADIDSVAKYNELQGEVDYGPTLIKNALSGPVSAISHLEVVLRYTNTEDIIDRTIETLKDLMILKGGLDIAYTGVALQARTDIAIKLGTDQILKAMKIVWDLQTKLSNTDSVRGLEIAYSLIGEILQVNKQPEPVITRPNALMSFAEMQRNKAS